MLTSTERVRLKEVERALAARAFCVDWHWLARQLGRKVIETERDKRTRLRFSRISIARCADLVRFSASVWGPLSESVHPAAR